MKKFEYAQDILSRKGTIDRLARLDVMGERGWELVMIIPDEGSKEVFSVIFKREIPEPPKSAAQHMSETVAEDMGR